MVWAEQWSVKVDGGIELNDHVNYLTEVPQLDDVPDWDVKQVPIDGTYPAYIRSDPTSGAYTVNIQMTSCTWATFRSRLATLDAIFTMGATHTLAVQVRGMSASKSVVIVPRGKVVDPKLRKVTYACFVPVPVLA